MPRLPEIRQPARRLLAWTLALALPLGLWAWPGVGPALAKALPPLSVMWQVDSTPLAGGAVSHRVTFTVTARDDFDPVTVDVQLPRGFTLAEGAGHWSGPLARDGVLSVAFVVQGPARGRVPVAVSGVTASNVHFSRLFAVDVPETHDKAARPAPPMPREPGPTPGIREFPSR